MAAGKRSREVVSAPVEIELDAEVELFLDCLTAIVVRILSGVEAPREDEAEAG
jgi:hypothetical protein